MAEWRTKPLSAPPVNHLRDAERVPGMDALASARDAHHFTQGGPPVARTDCNSSPASWPHSAPCVRGIAIHHAPGCVSFGARPGTHTDNLVKELGHSARSGDAGWFHSSV